MIYNSLGVQPDDHRLPADVPYRIVTPNREPPLTRGPLRAQVQAALKQELKIVLKVARFRKMC